MPARFRPSVFSSFLLAMCLQHSPMISVLLDPLHSLHCPAQCPLQNIKHPPRRNALVALREQSNLAVAESNNETSPSLPPSPVGSQSTIIVPNDQPPNQNILLSIASPFNEIPTIDSQASVVISTATNPPRTPNTAKVQSFLERESFLSIRPVYDVETDTSMLWGSKPPSDYTTDFPSPNSKASDFFWAHVLSTNSLLFLPFCWTSSLQ